MIEQIKELNFPKYATLSTATVNLSDMGENTISAELKIDGNIAPDFSYDWEVEFRGERYVHPLRKPQASKDNTSLDSVFPLVFKQKAVIELQRYYFFTYAATNSGTAVADQYIAPLSLNLRNFCDAFNQVLDYYFHGSITIDLNPAWSYDPEPQTMNISYSYLWDVLIKLYELYGVRWRITSTKGGYVIKVGYPTEEIDHIFQYGFRGGLLKTERQVQDDNIRNILLGRGGEKNLPTYYFKNNTTGTTFPSDPDWVPELANIYFGNLHDSNFRDYVKGWKTNPHRDLSGGLKLEAYDAEYAAGHFAYALGATDEFFRPVEYVKDDDSIAQYGEKWGALDNNEEIYPTIQGVTVDPIGRVDQVIAVEPITSDDVEASTESEAQLSDLAEKTVTVSVASANRAQFNIQGSEFTVAAGLHGTLQVTPEVKRIYNQSTGKTLSGDKVAGLALVETSTVRVYDKNTNAEVSAANIPAGTYYYTVEGTVVNNDSATLNITVGISNGKVVSSDKGQTWGNTFDIWIKNIWLTEKQPGESDEQYVSRVWTPILGGRDGEEAKVVFSTGWLSTSEDYEFTIVKGGVHFEQKECTVGGQTYTSEWRLTLAKSDAEYEATGLYLPNTRINAEAGDYFFFIGIELPHQYILWAEERLNAYKRDKLGEVADIRPTWVVDLDKIRISREKIDPNEVVFLIEQITPGASFKLADPRFITDKAYETVYVQSMTFEFREATDSDPALIPDVSVVLSNQWQNTASVVSTLEGSIDALTKQIGSLSNIEQMVRVIGDKLYLRKDGITDLSLSPTQFASLVTSLNFRQGILGGQGWGFFKDEQGNWSLEVDRLNVRQEMQVNELVINQISARGGMYVESAANMEVTEVVNTVGGYICYFDQKGGSVANLFREGDVALCHRFTAENGDLKFYKRRVIGIGVDHIILSETEKNGSGIPAEGDVIVQYGSYTDPARRYVKIRDVIGGGYERYIEGLDSVEATGTEYYFTGRQTGSYGNNPRFYIGNIRNFIEFINGELNIRARLNIQSTIGNTTIGDYVQQAADAAAAELKAQIDALQSQVDGVIESFNGYGAPTTGNYPANEWTTDEERKRHDRDIYTDITPYVDDVTTPTSGQSWKWYYNSPTDYGWTKIADSEAVKALQLAQMSVMDVDTLYIQTDSPTVPPALPTVNASGTITNLNGWSTNAPAWEDGKYMWQCTYTRYGSGDSHFAGPTCISGATGVSGSQGPQGVPGEPGKDGVTLYTWIRYANDDKGSGISNSPVGKAYIGFAYNKTTQTESNDPADYMWSKIEGTDGQPGAPGEDGKTLYTWIKYSDNANGVPMYELPNANTKYIGIATNKETATEGTNPNDYTWSLFRGENGEGITISSQSVTYSTAHTASQPSDSTFTLTSVPTLTAGQYLWSRTEVVYSNGQGTVSYAVSRVGADGAAGANYTPNIVKNSQGPRVVVGNASTNSAHISYEFDTPIDVKAGDKFTVSVENIEVLAGNPAGFSALFYNDANHGGEGYMSNLVEFTKAKPYVTLTVSKAGTLHMLILYAGVGGATGNNSVRYTKVMLVKGDTPMEWCPAASEMLAPTITSTSVTYAKTTSNAQPADTAFSYTSIGAANPGVGDYLWTKTVVKYSDNSETKSYSVGRIGSDGDDAVAGLHIAYASAITGNLPKPTAVTGFSTTMFSGAKYIGIYTDDKMADSTNFADYEWALFKGENGSNYSNNLYLNSAYTQGTRWWSFWGLGTQTIVDGVLEVATTSIEQIVFNKKIEVKQGEKFTLSGWIKANQALTLNYSHLMYESGANQGITSGLINGNSVTTDWKFFIIQFTASRNGVASAGFGWERSAGTTVYMKELKWERGFNDDPQWTPAASEMIGRGITAIVEQYALTANTTAPAESAFSDTIPTMTAEKPYLWNRELTTYSDNSSTATNAVMIGVRGQNGDAGATVVSVTNYYLASASASGVTTSTAGWVTDASASAATMSADKPYLWNYEVTKWSKGADTSTTPHVVGKYGASYAPNLVKGGGELMQNLTYAFGTCPWDNRPAAGTQCTITFCGRVGTKDGYIGVYQNGGYNLIGNFTSKTEAIQSFKFTVIDNASAPRTDINFFHLPKDDDYAPDTYVKWAVVTLGDEVVKAWVPAASEMVAPTITEQYYLSTSNTSLSGGSWQDTAPTWVAGKYIWTRTKITYGTGEITYTDPVCATGATGAAGQDAYVLDLSDEMIPMPCNAAGTVVGSYKTSQATVYKGTSTVTSGVTYSIIEQSGVSASVSTSGLVTPSNLTADRGTIVVQALVAGVYLKATLNVYKVKPGANYTDNIILNSNFSKGTEQWTLWSTPTTHEIVEIDGKKWAHIITPATMYQGYNQRRYNNVLKPNQAYTLSFLVRGVDSRTLKVGIHWLNSSNTIISQSWPTYTVATTAKLVVLNLTTPANCVGYNLMIGNGTENIATELWFTDLKLEEGTNTSPQWTPAASEMLGTQGYSVVASVSRPNFTEAQWATYGTVGHVDNWGSTASIRNGCRIGDYFRIYGTATNTGNSHVLVYKSDTASGDLHGECVSHEIAEAGDDGAAAVVYSLSLSANSIVRNALGKFGPEYITAIKCKTTGNTALTQTTEKILKVQRIGIDGVESVLSAAGAGPSAQIGPAANCSAIVLTLYDTNGTTVLDRERIPILQDAPVETENLVHNSYIGKTYASSTLQRRINLTLDAALAQNTYYTFTIWGNISGSVQFNRFHTLAASNYTVTPVKIGEVNGVGVYSVTASTGSALSIKNIDIVLNSGASGEIQKVKIEKGTNAVPAWTQSPKDVAPIVSALSESTTIDGGLILSSLIQLGYTQSNGEYVTTSGINGIASPTDALAVWTGGEMVDKAKNPSNAKAAKAALRHDGTAYFCNNTVKLSENAIAIGDNVQIDASGLSLMVASGQRLRIADVDVTTMANDTGSFSTALTSSNNSCTVNLNFYKSGDDVFGVNSSTGGGSWAALPVGVTTTRPIGTVLTISTLQISCTTTAGSAAKYPFTLYVEFRVGTTVIHTQGVQMQPTSNGYSASVSIGHLNFNNAGALQWRIYSTYSSAQGNPELIDSAVLVTAKVTSGTVSYNAAMRTVLGNNGLLSIWGPTKVLWNQSSIELSCNLYGIRILPTGFQICRNGSWATWTP